MAGKPFLSKFGGRKGKYKLNKNSEADKENHMDGKYRKTSHSDNEPPNKKRKTEEEEEMEKEGGDEFWDEFTQADLEDLEVQASQAYKETAQKTEPGQAATGPQPSTSAPGHVSIRERDIGGTFLKPRLSRSSSSSSSSLTGGQRSNTSHYTSGRSSHGSHSSHSSYPSSLSYTSTSSSSLKSGSSSEGVPQQHSSLSRGVSSESLDMSAIIGRNVTMNQPNHEEISRFKQECAALQLKLDKMKEEICVKDGENKLLRDNLKNKDLELSEIKMEKVSQINQQAKQQSEKEKMLQTELIKVQTQLQFKELEERETNARCRELESQIRSRQTTSPASQSTAHSPKTRQIQLSPKPQSRRAIAEERSPRSQSNFPTQQTFLASEVTPKKLKQMSDVTGGQSSAPASKPKLDERRLCTKLRTTRRTSRPGPKLVARLLGVDPSSTGSLSERGLVGLLNTPSTSSSLYSIQLDRDKNTSLLSPARGGLAAFQAVIARQQGEGHMIRLVSNDHFHLAMQGLTNLLTHDTSPGLSDQISHPVVLPIHQDQTLLTSVPETQQENLANTIEPSVLDNATLVLPLINDYLQRYIEMLGAALEASNNTTSSSSSFSSSDPSLESPTGSLGQLIKNTTNYANNLESLALASLHTLYTLLTCEGVKNVLMYKDEKETEEISSTASNEASSDLEAQVKETSPKLTHIPLKSIAKLKLLNKVIRLANPGSKENICNMNIVLTCLNILKVLGTHASDVQIKSMMPVLYEESLQHCIERETHPRIVIHGLSVLRALCKNNQVVSSLCTNSAGCLLLSMYNLCTPDACHNRVVDPKRLQILSLIVECVMCIASNHKGGLMILLESDCQCSVEVVKTMVCLLYSVMVSYKIDSADPSVTMETGTLANEKLALLREGLLVLHLMSQNDTSFMSRHLTVQHEYVQLVCGLTRIFKNIPADTNETEYGTCTVKQVASKAKVLLEEYSALMTILQDLWDFDHEDSELSHDSDTEEDGDTDRSDIQMETT